jgi:hypothetical protein
MTNLNQRIASIEIPDRMRHLQISDEGYPVPWFVPWIDSKPEFRSMDGEKFGIAVRHKRCWLCGKPLGKYMTFVIGPMCGISRTTAEPPCHHSCAEYAVKACPFLTQPRMRRNEKDLPEGRNTAGIMIKRNPGVVLMWTTTNYKIFKSGGILFTIGEPEKVEFCSNGRTAEKQEILESINSGIPILMKEAEQDGPDGIADLHKRIERMWKLMEVNYG